MISGKGRLIGEGMNLAVAYKLTVRQGESGPSITGTFAFADQKEATAAAECKKHLVLSLDNGRKVRGLCTSTAGDFQGSGDFF
jgi:hypothetical protein